jgi:outer membrane protein assembly factor BamB
VRTGHPISILAWCLLTACATATPQPVAQEGSVSGWLQWRGPSQDGSSQLGGLPTTLSVEAPTLAWQHPLAGRGTPVIADGRLYALGYEARDGEVAEVLLALDAATGERLWTRRYADFLSDIIYERYSIGSPAVDAATGHVYAMTSPGLLVALSRDGAPLWERSMMESFGRLTFPNGRTGSPVLVGDVVVVRGISTSWGALGPGRDRLFAFDTLTGELAWVSTPGTPPKDSSFSTPVVGLHDGRRVLYVGTGCGHVVCLSAHDGQPLWRFKLSHGGINATPLVFDDHVVGIHGKENIDSSHLGRMVAIAPGTATAVDGKPTTLGAEHERWRADLVSFTSSPVHSDGVIYQVTAEGNLVAVDRATGEVLWRHKLGRAQLHASPLMAAGLLYVPMQDGMLHALKPDRGGPNPISQVQLEGSCIGSPAAYGGRLYVHTTHALYAFGAGEATQAADWPAAPDTPPAGAATGLRVLPSEVLARQGATVALSVQPVDDKGRPAGPRRETTPMVIALDSAPRAGVETVVDGALEGRLRVRIVPRAHYTEAFDAVPQDLRAKTGGTYGHPPGWWSGAKMKWRVVAFEGGTVLAKTLDRVLFQRAMSFFGHPESRGYTLEALVRSDGNRRSMGVVGVVNQRYIIALDGNRRELTVHSNHDRFRHAVPFVAPAGKWMHLKTRVDVAEDGRGTIRAKAWPKGSEEPAAWTLVAEHATAHRHGAPGLFGFSPQSLHRVYVDDILMSPSEPLEGVAP